MSSLYSRIADVIMTIQFFSSKGLPYYFVVLGTVLNCGVSSAVVNVPEENKSTKHFDYNVALQRKYFAENLYNKDRSGNFTTIEQKRLLNFSLPFLFTRKTKIPNRTVDTSNREYIFRAPQTTSQLQTPTYQVQVYGNSQVLLEKVRKIEPQAFTNGNLIQVGAFNRQENAEDLLRKLALQGLWARIIINEK